MELVHTVSSNMVSCTVWPIKTVLVEVHDQVDRAGNFHINVALAKHQLVAVVRHDIGISNSSSAVVSISSLVDIGPLHDWLQKVLPQRPFILACMCVSVHHVLLHELAISLVLTIDRFRRELRRDDVPISLVVCGWGVTRRATCACGRPRIWNLTAYIM